MDARATQSGLALTELGFGTAPVAGMQTLVSEEQAAAPSQPPGPAASATSTPRPTTGSGSASGVSAHSSPGTRATSTSCRRRSDGCSCRPDATGRDARGSTCPPTTRRQWDFSRDGILRSVEESLGRLGLDRIDILYVHDPDDHCGGRDRGVPRPRRAARPGRRRGDRRRHEPVGAAGAVHPRDRHRPGDARRALHAPRPGRGRRAAAPRRRARRRDRRRRACTTRVCLARTGRPAQATFDYAPAPPPVRSARTGWPTRARSAASTLPEAAVSSRSPPAGGLGGARRPRRGAGDGHAAALREVGAARAVAGTGRSGPPRRSPTPRDPLLAGTPTSTSEPITTREPR